MRRAVCTIADAVSVGWCGPLCCIFSSRSHVVVRGHGVSSRLCRGESRAIPNRSNVSHLLTHLITLTVGNALIQIPAYKSLANWLSADLIWIGFTDNRPIYRNLCECVWVCVWVCGRVYVLIVAMKCNMQMVWGTTEREREREQRMGNEWWFPSTSQSPSHFPCG